MRGRGEKEKKEKEREKTRERESDDHLVSPRVDEGDETFYLKKEKMCRRPFDELSRRLKYDEKFI